MSIHPSGMASAAAAAATGGGSRSVSLTPCAPQLKTRRRAALDFPQHSTPTPSALAQIESSGIIACLRAPSGELAVEAACAALSAGVRVLEVAMATPNALDAVRHLSRQFPSATIGIGTVLTAADARGAVEAGAKFLMSPATVTEILTDLREVLSDADVLYVPGAMTPSEVAAAHGSGAEAVKIYPISALGGAKYLAVLRRPFPHIPMVASQGVGIDSIEAYLAAGASAVVLSDAIFGLDAVRRRDLEAIHRLAGEAASRSRRAVLQFIHQNVEIG